MTTERPDHHGKSYAEARRVLEQGAGTVWDAELVRIALHVLPQ